MKPNHSKEIHAQKALVFFKKISIKENITVEDIEETLKQPAVDPQTLKKVNSVVNGDLKGKLFILNQARRIYEKKSKMVPDELQMEDLEEEELEKLRTHLRL